MNVVGLDLAGVEKRPTGFCVLNEKLDAKTSLLYTNREITVAIEAVKPEVVSVDAPLALPKGRKSLDKKYSNAGHLRLCDRELLRLGIRFFPLTLGPMRLLTSRGIALKKTLESKGFRVIETYPGAAQDLLGIPRKGRGIEPLRKGLIQLGIRGDVAKKNITHHELDAVTCALVGLMYLKGEYLALGDPEEILMILPKT